MFNAEEIKSGLIGLLGWNQNEDPNGWQLTEMLTSESGLFFNSVHPLLTFENLVSISPEYERINYTSDDVNEAFTRWLRRKTEGSIIKALTHWINEKTKLKTSRNLLERENLFSFSGNSYDSETPNNKIVGIEIVPKKSMSLRVFITSIGLQFETSQPITIKLFRVGATSPLKTETFNYAGGGSLRWHPVNWVLEGNEVYYITYDSVTIQGKYINGVKKYGYYDKGIVSFPFGKYFKATSFEIDHDNANTIWDVSKNSYSISDNYGLNLKINSKCDYTNFIIEQRDLFKSIIAYQVGIDLLRELAFNPHSRINRNEANIDRQSILYEINGDTQGRNKSTLFGLYTSAMDSISLDENGIDKICLPCKKRGIKFKSIGPQ